MSAKPSREWMDTLSDSLVDADIPVLLMVLFQVTGDRRWIEEPFLPKRDVRLFPHESGGLAESEQEVVRAAARTALVDAYGATRFPPISDGQYAEMMSACVGEQVPAEYTPLFLEEMGVRPWIPAWETPPDPGLVAATDVLIVGAGISGLCAAIQLKRAGIPCRLIEKNPDVGGTWFDNTYPESGVDTPNHFYSYSFFPNPDWSAYFSKQPEMLAYVKRCAVEFDVVKDITFATTVTRLDWDADACRWMVTARASDGSTIHLGAAAVIAAVGQLNQPSIPPLPGLETFQGDLFHTARWRHDVDLRGKRVALIGAGASAMQVARSIAGQASQLTIFQRSPEWIAPNPDYHRKVSPRKLWLLKNVPFYAPWYRFVRFWRYGDGLHRSLFRDPSWPDPAHSLNADNDRHRAYLTKYLLEQLDGRPDLIAKALPDYPPYGKRMLIDNDWFTTIRRDNVALVTDPITAIAADGVATAARTYRADVIVMATGFHARRFVWPIEVCAQKPLSEVWAGDNATAYLGITVPGFPNFFLMHGPNTALAHGGSIVFHAECQTRYIISLLTDMVERGIAAVDCKQAVHDEYVRKVDAAHAEMVWSHPGMTNWYRNANGRVVGVSPWRLIDYWRMTHEANLDDYDITYRAAAAA